MHSGPFWPGLAEPRVVAQKQRVARPPWCAVGRASRCTSLLWQCCGCSSAAGRQVHEALADVAWGQSRGLVDGVSPWPSALCGARLEPTLATWLSCSLVQVACWLVMCCTRDAQPPSDELVPMGVLSAPSDAPALVVGGHRRARCLRCVRAPWRTTRCGTPCPCWTSCTASATRRSADGRDVGADPGAAAKVPSAFERARWKTAEEVSRCAPACSRHRRHACPGYSSCARAWSLALSWTRLLACSSPESVAEFLHVCIPTGFQNS